MIIDMRCRFTGGESAAYFVDHMTHAGRLDRIKAFGDGSIDAFFEEIGTAGITTAVSVSGLNPGTRLGRFDLPARTTSNDTLADVQRNHPGRFIAVGGIDASNTFHHALELRRSVHLRERVSAHRDRSFRGKVHEGGLDEEVLEKILFRNALSALRLDRDPVFRSLYALDGN